MKPWVKRGLTIAVAVAVIVGTYVFVLPQFADYGEVWDQVRMLSWEWIAVLLAAVALNLATFAPPWMAALPGLGYWSAEKVTTASTASTYLAPGGPAVGIGISAAMLLSSGFKADEVALAVTLTGVWNQLAILGFPALAFALLTLSGGTGRRCRRSPPSGWSRSWSWPAPSRSPSQCRHGAPRGRPRRSRRNWTIGRFGAARCAGTGRAWRAFAATRSACCASAGTCSRWRRSPAS